MLMSVYWMTEAVPLAVTSFIPVILFPLLDVLNTERVCTAYLKETNMMFIGEYFKLFALSPLSRALTAHGFTYQ
jgi:sodium-dependent dicarboxylate transporter 2/3/5